MRELVHTRRARPTRWDLGWIRSLVMTCRTLEVNSLVDFEFGAGGSAAFTGAIAREILHELRLVYFTPAQAKQAGSLETEHFGVLFPHRMSHVGLTGIPQRWLPDLTWDFIADLLRSPGCPHTASPIDGFRRAADAIQRITTENTTLKQRVRQLTADNRTLEERLKAARSNLRFQDRRVADLQAWLLDPPQK